MSSTGTKLDQRASSEAQTLAVVRQLLDRIEDAATGEILLPELRAPLPAGTRERAEAMVAAVASAGGTPDAQWPTVPGLALLGRDAADRAVRTSWAPTLAVTGADGLPPTAEAGNVLRPSTSVKLAIRIPPTCGPDRAMAALIGVLGADPPHGAVVGFEPEAAAGGWAAPEPAPWLAEALEVASRNCFGPPPGVLGEGGTIPFVGWLAERFPEAELVVTGVLGPGSNAHGPDEMLELSMAERLTAALAVVLDAHAARAG